MKMNRSALLYGTGMLAVLVTAIVIGCATGGGGGGGGGGECSAEGEACTSNADCCDDLECNLDTNECQDAEGEGEGEGEGDGDGEGEGEGAPAPQDLWVTDPDAESRSDQDFSDTPVPAGFFDFDGRSCDPFDGAASFVGVPINDRTLGAADTVVNRTDDPIQPDDAVGTTGTVEVQIVGLNLESTEPVTVMCDGQPTLWDVQAGLSDTESPRGTLTANKTHENGGTAQTMLPVLMRLTFTNVQDPSIQKVFDYAEQDLQAIQFEAEMDWVHAIDPNNPDPETTFVLGVSGNAGRPKAADYAAGKVLQGGTLIACTEHFNPGGSHQHNTCTADTDGDGVPDGTDNCRFKPNPGQADGDGDDFGDDCDACPDDPACPMSGGECAEDGECADLNDQLVDYMTTYGPLFCDYLERCFCSPSDPECAAEVASPECMEMTTQIMQEVTALTDVYESFLNLGCDRCAFDPPPPPPCDFSEFFGSICDLVTCPEGTVCDPTSGMCCDEAGDCQLPDSGGDLCSFISCPPGTTCDPSTGMCCDDAGNCSPPDAGGINPCDFIQCGPGLTCNPETGLCE